MPEPDREPAFTPRTAVWEITMACNMRCAHCGSSCTTALADELTTEEALDLCGQVAGLGVQRVTLSGGEPLLRHDWPLLAGALTGRGVRVGIVSNGWLLSRESIDAARRAGVDLISLSLDGLEPTHDAIRRPGSHRRVLDGLSLMRSTGFPAGVTTTILKRNLRELPALHDLLVAHQARVWQLQIGSAMGSLARHPEDCIEPTDTSTILDFAASVSRRGSMVVDLADCLGYYTVQDRDTRRTRGREGSFWAGCPAGRRAFGIRQNGDISACNAVRDGSDVEGNIRDEPLETIWTRPGTFRWYRARTRESLTGICRECQFGDLCLAGCTSVRRSLCGCDGEYAFCAYRQGLEELFGRIDRTGDAAALLCRARRAEELDLPDVAARCLEKALELDPRNRTAAARLAAANGILGRSGDPAAHSEGREGTAYGN